MVKGPESHLEVLGSNPGGATSCKSLGQPGVLPAPRPKMGGLVAGFPTISKKKKKRVKFFKKICFKI